MKGIEQFSLKGKVIVITGATGVLGELFSSDVSQAGAKVVVMGRNEERAKKRVTDIEKQGGEAIYVLADVLNEEEILNAKDKILKTYGTIDGLVNAAGGNIAGAVISPDQDLFEVNINDTRKAVDLNLFGTVIPTHVFGKVMAEAAFSHTFVPSDNTRLYCLPLDVVIVLYKTSFLELFFSL